MSNYSDLQTEVKLRTLLNGLQTKMAANVVLPVKGTTYTRDQLAGVVQGYLATFTGARNDRAQATQSAHARDAKLPEVRDFLQEVHSTLNTQFGADSPALLDYGYKPIMNRRPETLMHRGLAPPSPSRPWRDLGRGAGARKGSARPHADRRRPRSSGNRGGSSQSSARGTSSRGA